MSEPARRHQPGSVVWHHLVTTDVAASEEFYGLLFEWEFDDWAGENEERQIRIEGVESAGIVPSAGAESYWLPFVWVTDLDATLARVQVAGGDLREPPEVVPGFLRSAVIADQSGARIAPLEPEADLPWPAGALVPKALLAWHDLLTPDIEGAARFYEAVFGWNALDLGDDAYRVLDSAEQGLVAGIAASPPEVQESLWLTCVATLGEYDFEETADRAQQLGAELLVEIDRVDQNRIIFRDPTGAIFGLV